MKLRNKKTGEIRELPDGFFCGDNLKKICEEWEDYEEPKDNEYWYIDDIGRIQFSSEVLDKIEEHPNNWIKRKLYGNYFNSREEAEKAVEKLKAWKRLKEANIDFKLTYEYDDFTETMHANVSFSFNSYPFVGKDLDLLFGGEE